MSAARRPDLAIPRTWQTFVRSGERIGARTSIRAEDSEVELDVLARLEFLDSRRLVLHVSLPDEAPAPAAQPARAHTFLLTERERTVIALIATGSETTEIAQTLHISPATVRTHVRNAMTKLGTHTRAQLVAVAMAVGEHPEIDSVDDDQIPKSSS